MSGDYSQRNSRKPTTPGPGDYDVYTSGIEDRIRPSCQTVGAVYHKPTVRNERSMKIRDCEDAQSKELGPGYYDSSRGLNVVKPRSTMLVNIHSEAKPTPGLMSQSYWEQKASDLRETHDNDRPAKIDVLTAKVPTVSIAPPKHVNIRSDKELGILIRKKLQDVEMRTRGNYYNAKYDSCSWVKQPLVTKSCAREIARRVNRKRQFEKQLKQDLIEQILRESENDAKEGRGDRASGGFLLNNDVLRRSGDRDSDGYVDEKDSDGYMSPTEELVHRLVADVKTMEINKSSARNGGTASIIAHSEKAASVRTQFEKEITAAYLKSLKARRIESVNK